MRVSRKEGPNVLRGTLEQITESLFADLFGSVVESDRDAGHVVLMNNAPDHLIYTISKVIVLAENGLRDRILW